MENKRSENNASKACGKQRMENKNGKKISIYLDLKCKPWLTLINVLILLLIVWFDRLIIEDSNSRVASEVFVAGKHVVIGGKVK